ncbi:MAG: hypothetical protein M3N16_05420 [Actinomycetota bacterium]|nr:hypothetical protein [Actinomycetota bacterium]
MAVLGAIVDTGALLKVIVASLVAGVGVTAVFSLAIAGVVRFTDLRRDGRPLEAAAFALVGSVALAASVGTVALGIAVMVRKG